MRAERTNLRPRHRKQQDIATLKRAAFDEYWQRVTWIEEYVVEYGHYGRSSAGYWDDRLATAYKQIEPYLNGYSGRIEVKPSISGHGPFWAESAHDALAKLLNPPEALFGQQWFLNSAKYLAVKERALGELELAMRGKAHRSAAPVKTGAKILHAMLELRQRGGLNDMTQNKVAELAGIAQSTVCRWAQRAFPKRQWEQIVVQLTGYKAPPRGHLTLDEKKRRDGVVAIDDGGNSENHVHEDDSVDFDENNCDDRW